MTPTSKVIADIGTDHGYLPIALVKGGKADKVYAMDVNQGPLDKAKANISEHGEKARVITILSDGLEHLPEDVGTVVIAGMGGMLIGRILGSETDKVNGLDTLILSPHLDETAMRRKIHELGWSIEEERMVKDNDKFYTVMCCVKGDEHYTEREYTYGKQLLMKKDPVWLDCMSSRLRKLEIIKGNLEEQTTDNARKRLRAVVSEIMEIQEVIR